MRVPGCESDPDNNMSIKCSPPYSTARARPVAVTLTLLALAALSPGAAQADLTLQAAITAPATGAQCQPVALSEGASRFNANAYTTSIAWNTGDGWGAPIMIPLAFSSLGNVPDPLQTTSITFTSAGTYTVGVRLTDSAGGFSEATTSITITPITSSSAPVPVPSFAPSTTVAYAGQPIMFDGSTSYEVFPGAGCSNVPVTSNQVGGYTWDFGDGAGGTPGAATVSHAYGTAGTYNVILRVASTDQAGGQASATHTVSVLQPPAPPAPPPPPPPPSVALPKGTLDVGANGYVSLRVRCLATTGVCAGQLRITAVKPKPPKTKKKATRASTAAAKQQTIVLAKASFSIAARHSKLIRMRLSKAGRADVVGAGKKGLAATLTAQPSGAHVALAPASQSVRLVGAITKPRSHR
jgi:PKD repeat protein